MAYGGFKYIMDAAAEIGRNPVSNHQIQPQYGDEQAGAGRDCRTRLRCERGQGSIHFLCSADHEQDWQPYPVDPYSYSMLTIHRIGNRDFRSQDFLLLISVGSKTKNL